MALIPPEGWEPKADDQAIRDAIFKYQTNPELFDDEQVDDLETHASHFRVPFARTQEHQDSMISRFLWQAGQGFSEGFTTIVPEKLGLGSEPRTTGEAIARNLGHLAGFVGYLPGGKWIPALRALRGKSIPMQVASYAQKKVGKKLVPMLEEMGPMAKRMAQGNVLADMAQGAFHLGVASATSSWMHGVDEMVKSAGFGATFGAAFRGIGNLPGFGEKLKAGSQINMATGAPILSKMSGGQKADLTLRTIAGATFQGLPSTLQDATTEEQVYNYMMGAFFGFHEQPFQTRKGREFIIKSIKDKTGPFPNDHPEFDKLTDPMQKIVNRDFTEFFGPEESRHIVYDMMIGKGINIEDLERLAEEHDAQGAVATDPVTGEIFSGVDKTAIKKYREHLIEVGAYEDMDDLDMHIAKIEDLAKSGQPLYNFVVKNLPNAYENDPNPDIAKVKVAADINNVWKGLHYIAKDGFDRPKANADKDIVKHIELTYETTLNEEQKGWWRAFYEQNRRKKPVQLLTMQDGETDFMDGPVNGVGNRKDIHFEPPLIEQIFKKERAQTGDTEANPFYTFLDHLIYKGREYSLYKVYKELADDMYQGERNKEINQDLTNWEVRQQVKAKAKEQIDKDLGKAINKMNEQGYYYVGGKGDAKRMYFVRYHPKLRQNFGDPKFFKEAKKRIKREYKALGKNHINYMTEKEWDDAYTIGLHKFKESLAKDVKDAERIYDKSLLSNYMYDISFNGFELSPMKAGNDALLDDMSAGWSRVLDSGYINRAKGYNKRAQIWFNTGLSAGPEFIKTKIKDTARTDTGTRAFNIRIFSEPKTPQDKDGRVELDVIPNSLQSEATDGGIIGRSDVIDALNLDKGLPTDGGVNKSFIVAPDPKYGALLGKYMIHTATPTMEKWMKDEGIHMLVPESALKQLGSRKPEPLKYLEDLNEVQVPDVDWKVPIHAFRTIMSEKTGRKYIDPQKLPKQMFTTLSAYGHEDIDFNVIQDMYNTLSQKAMVGSPEVNEMIKRYEKNPSKEMQDMVAENLDEIPLPKLLSILRDPSQPAFASKLYQKILRHNDDMLAGLGEEGEISREVVEKERIVAQEFQTVLDRLLTLYPEGNIGAYLHKFSRDYRMTAIRNYVVNRLTRPQVQNSGVARMRPFSVEWLEKNDDGTYRYPMGELEMNDKIFFLDDGFKAKRLQDSRLIKGRERLGQVWTDLQAGKYKNNKKQIEEILNAAVMRVPMDSMSGTNILQFAGFTGVRGYGVLLHSRSMRALGGADLDGDKAWVFFGGEGGLKKEWKDMYGRQRDEFVTEGKKPKVSKGKTSDQIDKEFRDWLMEPMDWEHPTTGVVTPMARLIHPEFSKSPRLVQMLEFVKDTGKKGVYKINSMEQWIPIKPTQKAPSRLEEHNKNEPDLLNKGTLREQFILTDEKVRKQGDTPFAYYDPYWRYFMSQGAATGRDVLGLAVTQRASIIGAYNAIRGYTGKDNAEFKVTLTTADGFELRDKNDRVRSATAWMGNGKFSMPFADKNGNLMRVVFKVKTDPKSLKAFRARARTAIALGSDPMDEAGLQDPLTFGKKLMDTIFDYEVRTQKGQTSKRAEWWTEAMRTGDPKANHLVNKGLQRMFGRVNNLIYSKNFKENRRHSHAEIHAGMHALEFLPEQSRNTLLPMLSRDIATFNWSDNVFRRIDFPKLMGQYRANNKLAEEEEYLKDILDRKSIGTPMGKLIKLVMDEQLYTTDGLERLARNRDAFEEVLDRTYGRRKDEYGRWQDLYVVGEIPWSMRPRKVDSPDWRRAFLEHLVLKAEDYVVNDLSDMVTLGRLVDIIKGNNIAPSRVSEIHKMTEYIKDLHYMKAGIRRSNEGETKEHAWRDDAPEGIKIEDYADVAMAQDKSSVKADQILIDHQIRDHKKTLDSRAEVELYDTLLLGTFQRGNSSKIQELRQTRHRAPHEQEILELLEKQSMNTALSRVGLNSPAVEDANIRRFFEEYNNLFKKVGKIEDPDLKLLSDGIVPKEKVTTLVDGEGKRWEGQIIEESDLNESDNKYLDEIEPFRGVTKGDIKDAELREVYMDIKYHLENNLHNSTAKEINEMFRGIIGKNINVAHKQDLIVFRNWLDSIGTPTFWRRSWDFLTGKSGVDEIKRIYYMQFPATIDRNLAKSPAMRQMKDTIGPYVDRLGNTIMGKIKTPMSPVGEIQQFSGKSTEIAMSQIEQEKGKLKTELAPYVAALPEGEQMYDMAVAIREREMIRRVLRQNAKDPLLSHDEMVYEEPWKNIRKAFYKVRDKNFKVVIDGKTQLLTGKEVINNINKIITKQNEVTHKWLVGDSIKIGKWLDIARNEKGEETWEGLDKLKHKWFKYNEELIRTGKKLPIEELGIDGIRQIGKRVLSSFTPKSLRTRNELARQQKSMEITSNDLTGELPFEAYFPHLDFDRQIATANLDKAIEHVTKQAKKGEITIEERDRALKRLMTHYRQVTGDWLAKDEMGENFDAMQEVLIQTSLNRQKKAKNILTGDLKRVGNQFSRKAHLGGWNRSPEAYDQYMKSIIDTFYKQAMQIQNRIVINEFANRFYKSSGDAKLTNAWQNFFKLYAQSSMGYPTHIPDKVMRDPNMKIKMTPYKWFSDSQTKKRVDYIRKKLGIQRKQLKKWGLDKKTIDELSGISYGRLNAWSALEAKYELASLLAHPKTAIANLYGGTVHTVINTGFEHFRNARNFEYLKTHINPQWKGMEDVQRWLQELGVTEEFLIYEAGINPSVKGARYDGFVRDVVKKLKKDPSMSDKTLLELKKKHKLTETMWNFAASFMRVPERILRRDAFMAHLLQAKSKFGNAIKDFDHPFLIEMAKRGVKATQFLYSAPYRPMWTNSSLGRVMSRFQLWSWNSVRFRNDILREAKVRGVMPGTEAYDRMVRLGTADAFMLAMSNIFLYSLFESALPAPWNWFQDTADWLMGDDRDKERAFYGSVLGPAQMITPPSLRLVSPMFKWLVHGDSERLSNYYMWTMLPFGRMFRDIWGPGGALENPYYAVTKISGIPISQIGEVISGTPTYNPKGY